MTFSGGLSRRHRFRHAKSQLVYLDLMAKVQTVPRYFHDHMASRYHGTLPCRPHLLSLTLHQLLRMQGQRLTRRLVIKQKKYKHLSIIHNFIPFALETGCSWNSEAIELTNDIGNRITAINSEPIETQFLFQRISITVLRGNALAFRNTFPDDNQFSDP